jgi:hypothetical protein
LSTVEFMTRARLGHLRLRLMTIAATRRY